MRRFPLLLLFGAMLLAGQSVPAKSGDCQPADMVSYVGGDGECLAIQTFLPANAQEAKVLVVALHGDLSRGGGAEYFFPVAERAAEMGAVGVAMMRPGYSGDGRRSTGTASRDENRDQIYTPDEMDAIAEAVQSLKEHYGVEEVALIGHSGGAVMSGVILGRHPGLVQRALLLSCPCDIPTWRNLRGRQPLIRAESPHDYLDEISPGTVVRLVTGSRDTNTFPVLSRDYAKDAQNRGLDAVFIEVEGASHSFSSTLGDSEGFSRALEEIVTGR